MNSPIKVQPRRAGNTGRTKVRTGCVECKKRHVKCGEQKPACARCVRLRVACQYKYAGSASAGSRGGAGSGNTVLVPILPANDRAPSSSTPSPPTASVLPQPAEHRLGARDTTYFDYFKDHVVKELANSGVAEFWTHTVLREAARERHILDGLLGLGAVARARSASWAKGPLMTLQAKHDGEALAHYQMATRYYLRSIKKLRELMSQKEPNRLRFFRSVVVSTFLLVAYEVLQGNTEAVDKLMAGGMQLLKDTLKELARTGQSSVAARIDDNGIYDAELYLIRGTTFNAMLTPRKSTVTGFPYFNSEAPWPWMPTKADFPDFRKGWWRVATITTLWQIRTTKATPEDDDFEDLLADQQFMIDRVTAWLVTAKQAMAVPELADPFIQYHLRYTILGADGLNMMASCVPDDRTGSTFDRNIDKLVHSLKVNIELVGQNRQNKKMATNRNVLNDGVVATVLTMAMNTRDKWFRWTSLKHAQSLVQAKAGWDLKCAMLACAALLQVEEPYRREEDGVIPMEHRYVWTGQAWDEGYTEFYVTLQRVLGPYRISEEKRVVTVRPDPNGLIGMPSVVEGVGGRAQQQQDLPTPPRTAGGRTPPP